MRMLQQRQDTPSSIDVTEKQSLSTKSAAEILSEEFHSHQSEIFLEAIQLNVANRPLVHIKHHLPLLVADQEVHAFNLYGHIPSRLQGKTGDIAMWLLETESLRRIMVCKVLVRNHVGHRFDELNNKSILSMLAKKICSLDVAGGFVDGLKYLLPVVGAVRIEAETITEQSNNDLRIILTEYAVAHMKYSAHLLFPSAAVIATGSGFEGIQDITPVLVAVAYCILDLCGQLHLNIKPHSQLMSDFFSNLRDAVRESDSNRFISSNNLSIKFMTDLFNQTAAGRSLSGLKPPEGLASFLFASFQIEGDVAVGFLADAGVDVDEEDAEDINKMQLHAKLGIDALYLFGVDAVSPLCEHGLMIGCIPLHTVQVAHVDVMRSPSLLAFTSVSHNTVPYISFMSSPDAEGDEAYREEFKNISFHRKILLDVCPSRSRMDEAAETLPSASIDLVDEWIDLIESCCWHSRSKF